MLTLRVLKAPHFPLNRHLNLKPLLFSTSMDPTTTTVEHLVLFKIRAAADPSQISAMLANLRSLSPLPVVSHLTAGPILRHRSPAAAALGATHLLHCRYNSKPDLAAYTDHPNHVAVVKQNAPFVEDITAVDWTVNRQSPALKPGSALRFVLGKGMKEEDVMKVIGDSTNTTDVSFGENFSPGRAKGFTVGLMAVFPSVEELEREIAEEELAESIAVMDYVVP